jgi:glycosyltransferase involved in cell wall biosynthesis
MKAGPTIQIVCGAGTVSGKEIVSVLLAQGLRDAGWSPEFITSRWGDGEFVRRLKHDGFKYQLLRLGFISASLRISPLLMTLDQLRFWPALAYRYNRLINSTTPRAVIHTNWHHALLLLPFLKARRDIFWVHEVLPNVLHYSLVFRAIAKRVGRVVCVSHAVARSVLALGVPEARVSVIHNGLPPVEFTPAPADRVTLRLGIVGQIGAWKGHEDVLDALALLAHDGDRVIFRIFGVGASDYIASLKQKSSDLNLDKNVEWCGFVSDLREIFAATDVCVVPSRSDDPLPTSALEAGAFGRPVIGSSRGGLPEIIEHGVTGFVIGAQRPDQLAQAIKSFVDRPDLIKTMGEAARKRIRSEFSLGRCVAQFGQIIAELETGIVIPSPTSQNL